MNKRVRKLTKAALVIMSAIMLFACIGSLAKPKMVSAGLIGDVNEDGIVNSKDLSMVQKIIIGKYEVKETETPVETAEPSLEPVVTPSNDEPPMQMMFDTLDEFFTWIENKEERYDKIYKYYESIEEDGGVWVPYYDGEPVQFEKIHECSTGLNGDTVKWGYGYDYSLEKFEEEGIEIRPYVFLTDEEDKAEIQANYRDWFKGYKVEMSDEEFESKGYQEIIANVGGQNIPVIYKPDSETDSNERAFFLYEGECMYVLFYSSDTETNLEVLEKLSFEKVLLPTEEVEVE